MDLFHKLIDLIDKNSDNIPKEIIWKYATRSNN